MGGDWEGGEKPWGWRTGQLSGVELGEDETKGLVQGERSDALYKFYNNGKEKIGE